MPSPHGVTVADVTAITPSWHLSSLASILSHPQSKWSFRLTDLRCKLSMTKPHIWSPLLITGCLPYVDRPRGLPQGVK